MMVMMMIMAAAEVGEVSAEGGSLMVFPCSGEADEGRGHTRRQTLAILESCGPCGEGGRQGINEASVELRNIV